MPSNLPGLIVTGASGFVGRHLVQEVRDDYRVFGLARRSQARCGVAPHANLSWLQADVGERPQVESVFQQIQALGGADTLVHLAAHYDFTGVEVPEYWRTNVIGLRHVLEAAAAHGVRHFVFASSVLACRPPRPGRAITEESPPHGQHVDAVTKREGEALMFEFSDRLHPVIVRLAPIFSDWCEYPPLFMLLERWLSDEWNRRLLCGQGRSAVPYLHISDLVLFLLDVLDRLEDLKPCEVLMASSGATVSHRELYEAATLAYSGVRQKPRLVPQALCARALAVRDLVARVTGHRPADRAWMPDDIDTVMTTDARRTRARLDWAPRPRLEILRRMPFLIENFRTDPVTWAELNRAAMTRVRVPANLKVHWLLEQHQETVMRKFTELLTGPEGRQRFASYQARTPDQHDWHHRVIYRNLLSAVRTRDKGVFMGYCRDLAERRQKEGFTANELCGALEALNLVCWRVLRRDPESRGLRQAITDYVTSTLRSGCDQAQEVFELAEARRHRVRKRTAGGAVPQGWTSGK
jgi:nucleoside-diphosphate-sugar epimerase